MPVLAEIALEPGVVRYTVEDRPTVEEITTTLAEVYSKPEYSIGMGSVWDFRATTISDLSVDKAQEVLRWVVQLIESRGLGRVAIVVSSDVDHVFASMFNGRVDGIPIERRVFRNIDEAVQWASRPYWDESEA